MKPQPIDTVVWLDVNQLTANDYNPNSVDKPEMDLLALSIVRQGWIQPILVWPEPLERELDGSVESQPRYTIIDGFHRHMVTKTYKQVWSLTEGRVPVVIMDMTLPERMLLTIRINRAKGTHAAVKMHEIVASLVKDHGLTQAEIAKEIGADKAEIELLVVDGIFAHKKVDELQFTAAWTPKGITEHGMADV